MMLTQLYVHRGKTNLKPKSNIFQKSIQNGLKCRPIQLSGKNLQDLWLDKKFLDSYESNSEWMIYKIKCW